ncbi:MAG: Pectate trisaccharide-lyase precursor [Planctomycetes bacterium ADurb.Bin401]|nr:MAG: Pectate trisaccharide-lyase precursor [Planctomycetes bacterium ADurb.Bin401]
MDNRAKVGDGDCITIDAASNIWVDHCTFTDGGDGCVDVKNGADYVTISWCKFQYTDATHNYSNLVGHSDTNASKDMGHLLVTFHHNWYTTLCHERMPSVRFGTVHVYNTYFDCPGNNYCIRTRLYAQCRVENNYFNNVGNPWERYVTSAGGDPGMLYASGNILDNVIWHVGSDTDVVLIPGTDTVFTPPYAYTLDSAADVPAIVQYGAGADGKDGLPPHWYFGMYGDFDKSGFVDVNDFAQFANFWRSSNCEQLWNADYDGDCIVDNYELSLIAENWLFIPPDVTPPEEPTALGAIAGDSIVSLNWDDNSEEDLAGYNIYRSTTSGSGYVKLNGLLLSNSDYTDNSVVNNTTYFYVVIAVDTSENESGYSSEAVAFPSAGSSSITIQENTAGFCGLNGAVENEHSGYTGTGYANTLNGSGNGINWSVNILTAGNYTFTWRYASISGSRPANLLINGTPVVSGMAFPNTGAWTSWTTISTSPISLTAGVKAIRLQATSSDGLANIDYINIAGENLMPASCP